MLIVFLMITTYFSRFFIYLQGLLNVVVVVFQVGQIYFLLSSYCNNNTVSLFSSSLLFFFFYYTRSTGERSYIFSNTVQ